MQLTRNEDWSAVDSLLSILDRHHLQDQVLMTSKDPATPRDNLSGIGHCALDAAVLHTMHTGEEFY